MPKVGAHVSAAVSLDLSFKKAKEIGAEAIQIFISPPQRWAFTERSEEEIEIFRKAHQESGIDPVFVHGTYLINLATGSPEHLEKSIDWLVYALRMTEKLGVMGVIFHTGSHGGQGIDKVLLQVSMAIKRVLGNAPGNSYLILETAANPASIGYQFSDLGKIIKEVRDERVRVCLDTQHCFGSGYDVKSVLGLKDVLIDFDKEIGLEKLAAIHANDSRVEYNSSKDRHENIGEGFIGKEGFENIINNPNLKNVPFILEVPGFADNGPDVENVQILKSLLIKA